MLTFTEHMKRIIYLAEQSLIHANAEKFMPATDFLIKLSIHTNEAMQQLDEMSLIKQQSSNPAGEDSGGPQK